MDSVFDIERGPLVRVQLIKLAEEDYSLLLTAHHIICDGWAIDVLVRDLGLIYSALRLEREPELGPADRFSDYSRYMEAYAGSPEGQAVEQHWLERFSGALPVLELPADRPRPPARTYRGGRHDRPLDPELVAHLKAVGAKQGCTLVTVLLAAFKVCIHRLSGQSDLIIGLPAAGQSATGKDFLVGHCVNLLPLRTHLDGDPLFGDYLKQVRSVLLDAYEHQQFTFGRLVQQLALSRDPGRIPLLPVAFNIDQGISVEDYEFAGMPTEFISNPRHFENFEIFLNVAPEGGRFVLQCYHNADLFDAATIGRWMSFFVTLLEGIVSDPQGAVGDLPFLEEAERERVVKTWNATQRAYPREATVHGLFEEQVRATPAAPAVERVGGESVTYAELNARAAALGGRLVELGVGVGEPVGLCVGRSVEMLVGALGILKAGGAYVPLDPGYPVDRLAFMIEDTGLKVLVTEEGLQARLPVFAGEVVCVAEGRSASEGPPPANAVDCGAEDLAYIMYTSGSTGRPKGAAIPHRAVVRLVKNTDYVQLGTETVMLGFAPISFDASTLELWGPLLNGGRVVLYPAATPAIEELGQTIRDSGVNTLWLTAELFRLVVDERLEDLRGVRQLLAGGDVLPVEQVKRVLAELPDCRLVNGYGPTENTTFTCCYDIAAGGRVEPSVPIGRPVANTTVYIVDEQMHPVPVGVTGRLYTGGDGLAREYWRRPELTAERFVPDPFTDAGGGRLYDTGDLARWLPDGTIEFLGRADRQVKIRGFRVEPGEVESALLGCEGVKQAGVTLAGGPADARRLAAVYVPLQGRSVTATDLRKQLRERLPDYMIPNALVEVGELPLTPSGKIDRVRLSLLLTGRGSGAAGRPLPQTAAEREVAAIWGELLGQETVHTDDKFMDLGGHSLLAIKAAARIRERMGVQVAPNALLFNTLEQVASMCGSPGAAGRSVCGPREMSGGVVHRLRQYIRLKGPKHESNG
ncbi:MAG: amino acid adenylation domain-containing protein [Deltaproteobacteria bacterium]|nr:amino acid adenylation domain-containing protein [Deltaproteobacteria bacterium]